MRILNENKAFIVNVNQILRFPKVEIQDNSFYFWNPINCSYSESIHLGNKYVGEYKYYELYDNGRLFYTPILFGKQYEKISLPLFPKIINTEISNMREFETFPFKNVFTYSFYDNGVTNKLLINDLKKFQFKVKEIVTNIKNGNLSRIKSLKHKVKKNTAVVYLNGYYQEISGNNLYNGNLDREWNSVEERNRDPEYVEWLSKPTEITIFEGWDSYVINEITRKLDEDRSVSVCRNCNNLLNIEKSKHRDRRYCYKEENSECVKDRYKKKKARLRAAKKTSN